MKRRDLVKGALGAVVLGGLAAGAAKGGGAPNGTATGTPPVLRNGRSRPVLHVPARDVPSPPHLNLVDQAKIALPIPEPVAFPEHKDLAAWRELARKGTHMLADKARASAAAAPPAKVEEIDADGAKVYVIDPETKALPPGSVLFDLHGGALIFGGGEVCRDRAHGVATSFGAKVWAVDYRMPPDHPFPAGLDDCVAAYRALLRETAPEHIVVKGDSAGGNLAAALLLRLRDAGLPMPAGCVLLSPEVDLTETGDSFHTNHGIDPMGTLLPVNLLYAGARPLVDPYVSPIFASFEGFPPTLLVSGTRDIFLSNSVRMHRALRNAGVYAELHIMEAIPHGFYSPGTPEEKAQTRDIRRFIHTAFTPAAERPRVFEGLSEV